MPVSRTMPLPKVCEAASQGVLYEEARPILNSGMLKGCFKIVPASQKEASKSETKSGSSDEGDLVAGGRK